MKIVQTPPCFYPFIGGTEQLAFSLSKELTARGHRVKVICANEPPVGSGVIENIEVKRIPSIGKIANTNITPSLPAVLLKERFDILHTFLPSPWSADISALLSVLKNRPLFLTYCNDIVGKGINKFIATCYNLTALKFLLRRSRRIFIIQKNYLQSSIFLQPFKDKIIVTPPGVDLKRFKPLNLSPNKEKTIFFLSKLDRFHRYKGLAYLLLSIKRICKKMSLKLYIGGAGELLDYYKSLVRDNNLEKMVDFLGPLNIRELLNYYNICDVFVLPSISSTQEGFGLVALEAMACKKPVIVTDIVGVAEDVKDSNAGIVIKPKDEDELSAALEYILLDEQNRRQMGENAYKLARGKYTWQAHVDIVEQEYKRT